MALESFPKISPANFSPENDLIQVYSKKGDYVGVINPSYIGGSTSPSGVAGAIQFSNGSAFASDATNLFWDDTNKRLGIGLNTPVAGPFQVKTTQSNANGSIIFTNNTTATILAATDTGSALTQLQFRASSYNFTDTVGMRIASTGYATTPTAMLQIVGSGSTSATTSLLVQNSSGNRALQSYDDRSTHIYDLRISSENTYANYGISMNTQGAGVGAILSYAGAFGGPAGAISIGRRIVVSNTSDFAYNYTANSSILEVVSTTQGFLPPRMTTTQKNAISSPASGLVVYDTTTNKLCCYNGTSWNDLF